MSTPVVSAAKKPVIGVVGPTASGKSALGIRLSHALGGEVVNVDSVQVYRGFSIGAAKVTPAEQEGIAHHLIDIFEPDVPSDVAQFREHALSALGDITDRNRVPILVGGSGMYLTVLLSGLAELPAVPDSVRRSIQELTSEAMYSRLMSIDPTTAQRLHPNDRQRVSRALEIWEVTGTLPSRILSEHGFQETPLAAILIVLCWPRAALYERINHRTTTMLTAGLLEETRGLLERFGKIPLLGTIGYRQAVAYLEGALPLEDVAASIALHTRRFAKRQMTYLRNEPRKRGWSVYPSGGEEGTTLLDVEEAKRGEDNDLCPKRRNPKNRVKRFPVLEIDYDTLVARLTERLTQGLEKTEVWYVDAIRVFSASGW